MTPWDRPESDAGNKTGIVHGSEGTRFLGYDVKIVTNPPHAVRTRGGTRRSLMVGIAHLEWPMELALKFAWERGFIDNVQDRKTLPRTTLLNLTEEEIVRRYVQELRRVSSYYSRAKNWKFVGNHLHWMCKDSLIKTIAAKTKTQRSQTYSRLKMGNAVGIHVIDKALKLLSPQAWKRYKTPYPDRRPKAAYLSSRANDNKILMESRVRRRVQARFGGRSNAIRK